MSKITANHLKRRAYVYVRQSTLSQVHHNLESQRRQYALAERARQLGWSEVETIDEDLGQSGSGHVKRSGFEALLAEVCQGTVGAIFATEASRLARNGQEWHRLLEFCGIVDTLLIDHDGMYDPKHPNDRLLLGLKGTMSELEVTTFRQRSQEAIRQMARRGEYYTTIAVGYSRANKDPLEKDPDEQVQARINLIFEKFREFGTGRQVFLWLLEEKITVPRKVFTPAGWSIEFAAPTDSYVRCLLKNPIYAGAYVFGRTRRQAVIKEGRKQLHKHKRSDPQDWEVLIHDHHEGYISWQDYLHNQETLAQNTNRNGQSVRGAPRAGKALLAGLVRCGRCAQKMSVQYAGAKPGRSGASYYRCHAAAKAKLEKQMCSIFGGYWVEKAVVQAFLEAISPHTLELSLQASQRLEARRERQAQQVALELERAHYEAERCRRQYDAVEPENRVVARTLEERWNEGLERVRQLQEQLEVIEHKHSEICESERKELEKLASDLPALWNHPAASNELKKRLLRTVIKEIVVYVEKKKLRVLLHWQGGEHTELDLRKVGYGEHRWKSDKGTIELIQQLARLMPDKMIAAQLNRMGIKSAKGHHWTRIRVGNFRAANAIANFCPGEREARGELNMEETAEILQVSVSTVRRMIKRKHLPAKQVCVGAPWIITSQELESFIADAGRGPQSGFAKQEPLDLQ